MKRLHIIGCPRSGTTLLMELISTCFKSDGYCSHEMSIRDECATGYALFFSKCPFDVRYIRPIFAADPNLFLIYVTRDPRDVISSMHTTCKQGRYFTHFGEWKEWEDCASKMAHSRRFVPIYYEHLVEEPDAVQILLMKRFPFLEKLHDFSTYQHFSKVSQESKRAMHGLRPVSPDRIGNWRHHLPRIKAQLMVFPELAQALTSHGYEKDDSWSQALATVTPGPAEDNYVKHNSIFRQWRIQLRSWLKIRARLKRLKQVHSSPP